MSDHTHPCGNCGEVMTHYAGSNQSCEDFISYVTNQCIDLDGVLLTPGHPALAEGLSKPQFLDDLPEAKLVGTIKNGEQFKV